DASGGEGALRRLCGDDEPGGASGGLRAVRDDVGGAPDRPAGAGSGAGRSRRPAGGALFRARAVAFVTLALVNLATKCPGHFVARRGGGTGRRWGFKNPWSARAVRVQVPPPAPTPLFATSRGRGKRSNQESGIKNHGKPDRLPG